MECAGKGRGTRCIGPARRRCGLCRAVAYCSASHQVRYDNWNLPGILCPCSGPVSPPLKRLVGWDEYCQWRNIPLHSPVAVLLHWLLTIYHAIQLADMGGSIHRNKNELRIHYLGPEKELVQFGALAELSTLLPGVRVHIELIGPAVPHHRDGERINLSRYDQCTDSDCICKSSNGSVTPIISSGQTS